MTLGGGSSLSGLADINVCGTVGVDLVPFMFVGRVPVSGGCSCRVSMLVI